MSGNGESVAAMGDEESYKEEVKLLITKECEKFNTCEQARQNFLTICSQVRGLQIVTDRSIMETLGGKSDVKCQLLGKRIYDEMEKIIKKYPILKMVVEGDIDLTMITDTEIVVEEDEVADDPVPDRCEVDLFQDKCDIEIARVVEFLDRFRRSAQNKEDYLAGIESGLFTVEVTDNFTTSILRGGLTATGRLTNEDIAEFNALSIRGEQNFKEGTRDGMLRATACKKRLEGLKKYFYPEIWELEDALVPMAYLRGQVVPYLRSRYIKETRAREADHQALEDEIAETEKRYADRLEDIKALIVQKWKDRKVLAMEVIMMSERKLKTKGKVLGGGDIRNLRNIITMGYVDVINEMCLKISNVADVQIKAELNRHLRGKEKGRDFYSSLDRRYLPGVMFVLREKYNHAPITMMFESLEELFSGHIDSMDARGVMEWMNSKIVMWAEFQFFEYMVPDVVFTFITLFRMPQGETRQRCCREVLARMREKPEDFLPEKLKENRSMGMGMCEERSINRDRRSRR
jgi:hypothetical protein